MDTWIEPFGKKFKVKTIKKKKKTARCPIQYILRDSIGREYLLVIARTDIQKFYLERSLKYQNVYAENEDCWLAVNRPVVTWQDKKELKVLYHYFTHCRCAGFLEPLRQLQHFYGRAQSIPCDEENIDRIMEEFLKAWPESFHDKIKELKGYKHLRDILSKKQNIRVCTEHGDYAKNNVVKIGLRRTYLHDYEFVREMQPIGFDMYQWCLTNRQEKVRIPYHKLNREKMNLVNEINNLVDGKVVKSDNRKG